MPESVVELVNHRMYEGKLRTPELTKQDKDKDLHHPPFEGGNVIFVDTSTLNPWCAWDTNYSRYNLYSAEIVSEIVSKEIRPAIKVQKVANVGVIAPYRAQKKLIRKICESKFDKEKVQKFIEFHTVDAFQGQERDVIVIDLTAGPPLPPGLRLSEQEEREKNPQHERSVSKVSRLLNVAITRTKKKLIIVGNKEYFERHLANGEFVLEVIELATRGWHQPPGTSVLQLRYDAELGGSSRFLDATSFYVHLRQDFQRCKTSAVIISPFVTLNRVGDLRPDILSMLKRGVKVTVVTKPLREAEFGRDALKQLESWGCDIKQRSRTHEKVVLIDDKIGYYGSLNTLSHKDTKELMFRFEGEEVSSLLCQFTGVLGPVVIPRHRQIAADAGTRRLSRDECRGKLKHLRFKIATQRHIPFYAPLYNQTIEALLDNPPTTEEELVEALMLNGEKQLKHLTPFLDEILSILGRYNP